MSDQEFEEWTSNVGLSEEAIKEIARIRDSPPSRRVGNNRVSVSGRYSSNKMKSTIQFESHKVELPAIYSLEFNEDVIEYYDQPPSIKINYVNDNGKKIGYTYTPDFFVIEKCNAYWIECKTEGELLKLSQKDSARYKFNGNEWIYEPGRNYAEGMNLDFKVFSSDNINWTLQRNLVYLEDYYNSEIEVGSEASEQIISNVRENPGISIRDLIDSGVSIDDLLIMVVRNNVYIDLQTKLISDYSKSKVFNNVVHKRSLEAVDNSSVLIRKKEIRMKSGEVILWGENQWKILNCDNKNVYLISDMNENLEVPLMLFEQYISNGDIKSTQISEDGRNEEIRKIIAGMNAKDLKETNKRYEIVLEFIAGKKEFDVPFTNRTIRGWVKKYRDAQEIYGNGFIGLIPSQRKKGNRKSKLPLETQELIGELIANSYETIKLKTAKIVYGELLIECEKRNLYAPSYQTFCKAIKNEKSFSVKENREGRRAAYEHEDFYRELAFTTPKHGERVFEISHIDHTQLDVEVIFGNGNESKRPWITFMIDAFSRKILSYHLSFEEPSSRSCMMVIRECVRKHNRLPSTIVVDGGKEFSSVYFESLLGLYGVHKKERPSAKARFGNVIERLFGVANKGFIHNLKGNTQLTKNVRQVTKSNNPKNHAVWDLESLNERLDYWVEDVYHEKVNPTLFQTPREIFEKSLLESGNRGVKYIPYDESFIMMTLPSPKSKYRKVHIGRGVKLNYSYYWCEEFKNGRIEESDVEVKYDPYNIGLCYVFINNKWVRCFSEQYSILNGKNEKEIKLITEKIRERHRSYSQKLSINAKMIAQFILETERIEDSLQEKNEVNPLNKAVKNETYTNTFDEVTYETDEVDTSKLKIYEDFNYE
ncbi:TnsA endonuclease N-terminal domain-containing protein [Salimicrobium flavidum]|nr:TnsA endonuclease N-terminal domain-containing protein [Salimicrobium flavidum]